VSALLKQQQQQLPPTGLPRRVLTEEQEQLQRKRSTELRHWERQLAQEQQRLDGCRTLLERELAKQTAAAAAAAAANATAAQDAAAAAATSRRASKGDKTANHAKPAPAAERAAVAFQNIMEEQPAAIAGSKRRSKGTPTAAAAAAAAAAEAEAASPPVDSGLAGVPLRVQLLSVAVLLVGMWLLGYWFGQSQGAAAACTATSGHVHMPSLEL
jgi:cobalamin biosynthesis Mg chelatase CobN